MPKKEILNDNAGITANSRQIEILKQNFPQCFDKDGNFIVHKMEEIVGESGLELSKESYSLNWLGKSYARLLANENPRTLLKEDKEHNAKEQNKHSQNILIKGDNLEVLKHLSNAYAEAIKMIYIDPPYNTGSDGFLYHDDRKFRPDELSRLAGIDIDEAKRILEFTQSNANSHSAWLTFMYPRLYVARHLLREDGVIFISIDDNEQAQLKLLCDEIFGEENFVVGFPRITKKAGKTSDLVSKNNDYVLVYRMSEKSEFNFYPHNDKEYKYSDEYEDIRGKYKLSQTLDYDSIQYSPSLDYEIELEGMVFRPGGVSKEGMRKRQKVNPKNDFCWRWSKKLFEFGYKNGFIVLKKSRNGYRIYTKTYKNAVIDKNDNGEYYIKQKERKKSSTTLDFINNVYSNDNAKKELDKLFNNEKVFDYPKPTSLVRALTFLSTNKDDIVLDFFAGSGTTGDAVMQLNAEDEGSRKYILVQLPEPIDPKKNKNAYEFVKNELGVEEPTIFEITKERLIRAAKKIKEDFENDQKNKNEELTKLEKKDKKTKKDQEKIEKLKEELNKLNQKIENIKREDLGFKIYETIPVWDGYLDEIEKLTDDTTLFDGSKLSDEELEVLLTTWKVHDGMALTQELAQVVLASYQGYLGEGILYLVESGFDTDALKALLEKLDSDEQFEPSRVVMFGYNFSSKAQRELSEALESYANKKSIELDFVVRY